MRNWKLIVCAMQVVGMVACSEEELKTEQSGMSSDGQSVITAYAPNGGSRVAISDTGNEISINWKDDEQINLFVDIKQLQPDGVNYYNYTNYIFTRESGNMFIGDAAAIGGTKFYAYYPKIDTYWGFPQSIPFYIDSQTGQLDESKTYMYAANVDASYLDILQFKHMTAIMKATFKLGETDITSQLTKIQIDLPEGAFSNAYINLLNDASATSGQRNIVVSPTGQEVLYIYLPRGIEIDEVLNFTINDANGKLYQAELTASKDIEAGKVYPAEVNLDLLGDAVWKSNTVASSGLTGSGTEDDPYLIKSANDLQYWVKNPTNSYYRLENNIEIQSDENNPWIPVSSFNGTLDGNNKQIIGTLVGISSNTAFVGELGADGLIKNLHSRATVTGTTSNYTAGIVAYNKGNVEYCSNQGNVTGGTGGYTGGVVGYNEGTVINGNNYGAINGGQGAANGYTGGVAGYNKGTLSRCNTGSTVTAAQTTVESYVGGITGFSETGSSISSCTNRSVVTGAESLTNYIGGLVGYSKGTIEDCNNQGNISSPDNGDITTCYLGGFSGVNSGTIKMTSWSSNSGQVKGGKANSIYVGGLVGSNIGDGRVENIECSGNYQVTGGTGVTVSYTGGLVALNQATVIGCKVSQNVVGGSASSGDAHTGGLVGVNGENGVLIYSKTQMPCSVSAGSGTTVYTGIYAGKNSGTIYPCCYAGGNQTESDLALVGNGNAPLSWEDEYSSCPTHKQE